MPDFSMRSSAPEIMDDLEYRGEMMDRTLHELEVINRLLGGNAVTIGALNLLTRDLKPENLSIADLGCGRGDMLRLINRWAKRNNKNVTLSGIDANPYIIEAARINLENSISIHLLTVNIFSKEFTKMKYDVVIGTLFYHHFTDEQLVHFFSALKDQARVGFIINDIHRHPLAYYSILMLTKVFSRSSMVKFDAPLSVLRAFKKQELIDILNKAGVRNYTIRWKWAFRWQVIVRSERS